MFSEHCKLPIFPVNWPFCYFHEYDNNKEFYQSYIVCHKWWSDESKLMALSTVKLQFKMLLEAEIQIFVIKNDLTV